METKAKRTLVKSAPELWALADDQSRMEAWTAGLLGAGPAIAIEVTQRQRNRSLAWRTTEDEPDASVSVELAEKGFGTSVVITARCQGGAGDGSAALERLLDELGSPERQPFAL